MQLFQGGNRYRISASADVPNESLSGEKQTLCGIVFKMPCLLELTNKQCLIEAANIVGSRQRLGRFRGYMSLKILAK
ncbi:hypothetical protein A5641_04350 [Mycobacterium sp. 1554424.7]|nr:hypothetical protein A5641_04350 [Mycobacterium sp. 1554424.7]